MGLDGPTGDEPLTSAERQFLIDSGAPADAFDPARQEAARNRLRARAEETRRKASLELDAEQVAGLLGCSTLEVLEWTADRDLYSFVTEQGLRFPEWQFPDGQRLGGMRLVLQELGSQIHPYSVEGFFADARHEELDGMTGVEWLASGGSLQRLVSLAHSHAFDM